MWKAETPCCTRICQEIKVTQLDIKWKRNLFPPTDGMIYNNSNSKKNELEYGMKQQKKRNIKKMEYFVYFSLLLLVTENGKQSCHE